MTDKELKKSVKKLGIIVILIFFIIIGLSIYTLGVSKADLSIYGAEEPKDNLQIYGINEEEFKQYLSLISLVSEETDNNEKKLDLATNFMDIVCPQDENSNLYSLEKINAVLKDILGTEIKENTKISEKYTYNQTEKAYTKISKDLQLPKCTEIKEISKNDEKIEVIYKCEIEGENEKNSSFKVKATILENSEYDYSKYFVSSIEQLQ